MEALSQDWHLLFSCSVVSVSATPGTAACQASLSFTSGLTLFFYFLINVDCTGSSLLSKDFSLVIVCGLLTAVASLVAEHRL